MSALLEVRRLRKHYAVRRGVLQRLTEVVKAVDGVDLSIERGECVALVGESGSGKTTLGRCVLRLIEATEGAVRFAGEDLASLSRADLRARRRHFQMIFQDPYGSLNPRMKVGRILAEPLVIHRTVPAPRRSARVRELLNRVGLAEDTESRYPHELSGGQRQRVGMARALAPEPSLIVADEPVSALDVSLRAQIINLLVDLRRQFQLAMLFIAHDLSVVEQIAHRVAVLYLGQIVESAPTHRLFAAARHPYTVSLLSAVPVADPERTRRGLLLAGEPPSPADPPVGCRFHPRCPIAETWCRQEAPPLVEVESGHRVACHFPGELTHSAMTEPADGTFRSVTRRTLNG